MGSGYFVVDCILPLETILPLAFMCVYIAIINKFLEVTIGCIDSAAVFKDYGLESLLAEQSSVH